MYSTKITKEIIDYFCARLSVAPNFINNNRFRSDNSYYNLDYYLLNTYYWNKISHKIILELFTKLVGDKHFKRVLDFGCGVGLYTESLTKRSGEYFGVDVSNSAIEIAKKVHSKNPGLKFIELKNSQDLENNSFDLIFCVEVLNHVNSIKDAFNFFRKTITPSGVIFVSITTMHHYIFRILFQMGLKDIFIEKKPSKFINRLWLYFRAIKNMESGSNFMEQALERFDHKNTFTLKKFRAVSRNAGFEIVDYCFFNCKDIIPVNIFLPINWFLRKLLRTSKIYGPNVVVLLKNTVAT